MATRAELQTEVERLKRRTPTLVSDRNTCSAGFEDAATRLAPFAGDHAWPMVGRKRLVRRLGIGPAAPKA